MDVFPDVTFRDHAIYFDGILVVADLHIGRGESSALELPVGDGEDMVDRFEQLCADTRPDTVVIAGDLLHSFETLSSTITGVVSGLERAAREYDARLVVTPGNHDTLLDAVWSEPTESEFNRERTVICHGHVEPETDGERYIIGHDHPTIEIEGVRRPCFLLGDSVYRGADLLVLPSFNRLVPGVRINEMSASDFMSPLITDVDELAPVVWDEDAEETLKFPPLGEFRHRL